ncbi:ricin-type beta-trefoil lectin domain protein [uncultured Pelagimonas sp.]|uniref:ricin-type beta-trefoil lectin domain protein n=1 Tax=uncultured Pelagimonas sp. TaxID=1618102 RepID=UPI002626D310|nr:ricin-type beta-trefoil lectin domain protein [uncultured Pelagimonas sp.]
MKSACSSLTLAAMTGLAAPALAEAPNLRTPPPVIFLAENLDEKDQLGWCIDTLGRGFASDLQVHSCKPQGGDVQFSFEPETGFIRSVAFPDYCASLRTTGEPTDFALVTCDEAASEQRFDYDPESGAIHPKDRPEHCLSAGQASRSAGPFMSRVLELTDCETTEPALRHWIVRN